jgi:hypothetical protein
MASGQKMALTPEVKLNQRFENNAELQPRHLRRRRFLKVPATYGGGEHAWPANPYMSSAEKERCRPCPHCGVRHDRNAFANLFETGISEAV